MRGRLLIAAVIAISAMTGVGAASAGACTNDAFRTGPSAALPECRAYEQVTPVDKEGGTGVYLKGTVQTDALGDGVGFVSPSAYADPGGNTLNNRYLSRRSTDAWGTAVIDGPQAVQEGLLARATFALSPDLGLALTTSKEAFAPGAIPGGSNLYLRDNATGAFTLIVALPGNEFFKELTTINAAPFVGAATDWSTIYLSSKQVLAPGAEAKKQNLYEYRDGVLTLVAPPGSKLGPETANAATPNVVTPDGSRLFYRDPAGVLYRREAGVGAAPITASERTGEEGKLAAGTMLGATPDGEVVFFESSALLTDDARETVGTSLYRWEGAAPAGERLTNLVATNLDGTTGPEINRAFAGEDGEYVYFGSLAVLAPGATKVVNGEGSNLYVWHGGPGEPGTVRYIARTTEKTENGGPSDLVVGPDGSYAAIESFGRLTPGAIDGSPTNCPASATLRNAVGRCSNAFLYSYDANRIECVSCTGLPPLGNSEVGSTDARIEAFTYAAQPILADGTFFFQTPNSLVPRDSNGFLDVYAWRAGVPDLLSGGTDRSPSSFGDVTADGSDVFIRTSQPLVPQDDDQSFDLYDVRVEGGLAGQQLANTGEAPCESEASCRSGSGPAAIAPASPPATNAVEAPGNLPGSCISLRRKSRNAAIRARALARYASHASGKQERILRRKSKKERRRSKQLARKVTTCGGGR